MRALMVGLVLTLAACGDSAGPNGLLDPSLLFNNQLNSPVYLTWRDGNAIVGYDTIPAHTVNHCSHFLAQADSAYFEIVATDNVGGATATSIVTAPWFHPEARPAWIVDITPVAGGSPAISIREVDEMCEL